MKTGGAGANRVTQAASCTAVTPDIICTASIFRVRETEIEIYGERRSWGEPCYSGH